MLNTKLFGQELKKLGFDFYSGVPCSFLKPLINYAINECDYIIAANEGDAVASCCGAFLGGRKGVVLMQNSGLTNAVSPLTSLNFCFKIPVLGFVSLRGEPGLKDEPQHELMGQITTDLLNIMKIKWEFLSSDFESAKKQLVEANKLFEKNETFFFVVKKDTFETEKLLKKAECVNYSKNIKPKVNEVNSVIRETALSVINDLKDYNTVHIATTGKTGRELFEVEDSKHNLYMVGSMGCASSLALGLSISNKKLQVIVIDGDGSAIMRMGNLPTNGFYAPQNLLHIILDNNTYDSTGGQDTVSSNVDFVNLAYSSGYPKSIFIHNPEELKSEIINWKKNQGLTLLYYKILNGSKEKLGRPTQTPEQVKERLMDFISGL